MIKTWLKSFLEKPSILSEVEPPFEKVLGYNFSNGKLDASVYVKVKGYIANNTMFKIEASGKIVVLE